MIQFYSPDIKESHILGPEESGHCIRVLRRKAGDTIYVTDGRGRRYVCRILQADPRKVELAIEKEEETKKSWPNEITIAVAPTKNADRMAWLVEKCTEMGVDRIIFTECRHGERKNVNIDRLRRNAISAMNQSLKTRLPAIEGLTELKEICRFEGCLCFGYCDKLTPRKEFVKEYTPGVNVTIAIGPEGDFSTEEVEMLQKAGYNAVTFGDERLRTETAAIYALAAVHVIDTLGQDEID